MSEGSTNNYIIDYFLMLLQNNTLHEYKIINLIYGKNQKFRNRKFFLRGIYTTNLLFIIINFKYQTEQKN